VARELLAEHRPAICEVRGRQHGDREPATRHAAVDLGDEHPAQRQRIEEEDRAGGRLSEGSR
jgi:hypothetical protein